MTKSVVSMCMALNAEDPEIVCEGRQVEPCKSLLGPFHLGIDQTDRIWVTNGFGDHVTRFPAANPSKAEKFKTGWSSSGLGIDSQGNVWVTNRLGMPRRCSSN